LIKESLEFPEDGRGNEIHTPGQPALVFQTPKKMIQNLRLFWLQGGFSQDLNDFLFKIIEEEALSDPTVR